VPHPFRVFRRKGWESNEIPVYIISKNIPEVFCRIFGSAAKRNGQDGFPIPPAFLWN
jgi:hypothetical protein